MDYFERVLRVFCKRRVLLINISGDYGGKLLQLGCKKKLNELGVSFTEIEPDKHINKISYYVLHLSIKLEKHLTKMKKLKALIAIMKKLLDFVQFIITRKALAKAISDIPDNYRYSAVLIHGSGTMSDITPTKLRMFKTILRVFQRIPIITGPQSYWFPHTDFREIIREASSRVFLFCREKYSHELLQKIVDELKLNNVYILLSHDSAFYLSKSDFGEDEKGEYLLISLREDRESVVPKKAKELIVHILRIYFRNVVVKDVGKASSFEEYVNNIKKSRIIITDRLHVAILGALLGKKVYLVSNVYHKNRGVYEYSLHNRYDVSFYDVLETPRLLREFLKVALNE